MPKSGKNRRRFDRRDTAIAARAEAAGTAHAGTVTNLSIDGCLFSPPLPLAPGSRFKLWLAGESKPLPASVVTVSDRGLHCRLHAAASRLAQASAELDDMALLLLNASRPSHIVPVENPATAKPGLKKPAAKAKKAAPKGNATAKKKLVKKAPVKRVPVKKKAAPKKKAAAKRR